MSWTFLLTATVLDVIATVLLKQSEGFSKLLPSLGTVVAFALSLFTLALALQKLDVIPVYVVWVGLGTALISLAGIWLYQENLSVLKIASILLILGGVIGLSVTSK